MLDPMRVVRAAARELPGEPRIVLIRCVEVDREVDLAERAS